MSVMVVSNVNDVLAAFDRTEDLLVRAVQAGVTNAGLAVERQARMNANNGVRRRVSGGRRRGQGGRFMSGGYRIEPKYHVDMGGSPEGPNVITGNLKRSINTTVRGFGDMYVATVGASMVYARAVELGLPQWKRRRGGYPYIGPAADRMRQSGQIDKAFTAALKRVIRSGGGL